MALCQPPVHHFQTAADPGEQVVEVMRQSTGELPDSLHFLGLTQIVLGGRKLSLASFHFAEISTDCNEVLAFKFRRNRPLDPFPSAVACRYTILKTGR